LGLHNKGHNRPPAFQASQCIKGTNQRTHDRVNSLIRCVTFSNSWNSNFWDVILHWWAHSLRQFEDHHAFISREKQCMRNPYVRKTVCCPGKVNAGSGLQECVASQQKWDGDG